MLPQRGQPRCDHLSASPSARQCAAAKLCLCLDHLLCQEVRLHQVTETNLLKPLKGGQICLVTIFLNNHQAEAWFLLEAQVSHKSWHSGTLGIYLFD